MASSELSAVLDEIRATADCRLLAPSGEPELPDGVSLPDDLVAFYELCGGATLFESSGAWRVSGPRELVSAAPRLLTPELAEELRRTEPEHVASTCFVFADNGGASTDEHLVVDLHPDRRGRFYETFWDRYGAPGDMPIVAASVADALRWLLDTGGGGAEIALGRRPVLGDAFD
jgi:antitoxin YokJ